MKANSPSSIKCPLCAHVHDATDNEIDGDIEGEMKCDNCACTFKYQAEYEVNWYSWTVSRALKERLKSLNQ